MGLGLKLPAAGLGKAIETRAAVVLRCAPLGGNRAFMLELETIRASVFCKTSGFSFMGIRPLGFQQE
jgi:hypothetical protein